MSAGSSAGAVRELAIGGAPPLAALLGIPAKRKGIVIFAHGRGSGRLSPRNSHVAQRLREAGLATLLLDLLSPREEADRRNVFDIALLASRLRRATDWAVSHPETADLPPCYFGASTGVSTGSGAALRAAAGDPRIAAVVSRGGRPDLAGEAALAQVAAPTLLIVGEMDGVVIELNSAALNVMRCKREIVIVPGAGHLFEEPGTLDHVVTLAKDWFVRHVGGQHLGGKS
jgi:putative phosphoribosyl transferase